MIWMCLAPLVRVEVEGAENVKPNTAYVIASNHQSTLDAFVYGSLGEVNLRVMYKRELLFWPLIGQLFCVARHVPVNRSDKESGRESLNAMVALIKQGVCGLFFPEGTRFDPVNNGEAIKVFKPGAAIAAIRAGVEILPMSLSGVRTALPLRGFPSLGWFSVRVKIHKPIPTAGCSESKDSTDVLRLMETARAAILSGLRPADWYAGNAWEAVEKDFTVVFEATRAKALEVGATEENAFREAALAANEYVGIPRDVDAVRAVEEERALVKRALESK